MSRKYKIYLVIIVVLAGGYAVMFANVGLPAMPLGGDVKEERLEVEQLRARLIFLQKQQGERLERLAEAHSIAEHFYPAETDPNVVRNQVEKLAYDAGLKYSSLRQVETRGEPEGFLRTEEVNITGTVELRSLVAFMQAIENHRPLLRWASCNVTPRLRDETPNAVFLSGRIQALVLTEKAAELLAGGTAE